jgi:transcription-repair coupling factor (superfamily II helicase)
MRSLNNCGSFATTNEHMIDELRRECEKLPAFQRLGSLPPGGLSLSGCAGSLGSLIIASLRDHHHRQIVVVSQNDESAERLRDDLQLLIGADGVRLFTGAATRPTGPAGERDVTDIQALRTLQDFSLAVIVSPPRGLASRLPSPTLLSSRSLTLEKGERRDFNALLERLRALGFLQEDFVGKHGDFAVRGGILDVFTFAGDNPVRAEFVGDEIESLREFDPVSQRSIRELAQATIVPDIFATDAEGSGGQPERRAGGVLLDYAADDAILVMEEPELVRSAIELLATTGGHHRSWGELEEILPLFPTVRLYSAQSSKENMVDAGARPQPAFNGSITVLRRDIAALQARSITVRITCDTAAERDRLKELLGGLPDEQGADEPEPDIGAIQFSLEALHAGFVLPEARLALFTEHQIFNRQKRRGKKRTPRFRGLVDRDVSKLVKGDYIVHRDFGVGRFEGLQRINVGGAEQEVVKLTYEASDALFVNLNYINRLQKYSSKEGHIPTLSRLGSGDWDRLRARAKKKVKDIARDLIALYARRKSAEGHPFSPDTPWQKELEASFMYEDTFDQAKATVDVKRDMEEPHPMDRLVCGDVGFGKTEVAVRAAFKSVLDGRQVAVLVPTTILAAQHGNTFRDRLARYAVRIEVMSRFRTKKEQTDIIARLKSGAVDIVIGTHRLLSKDVFFPNLGLLIIDEEHRFGVAAKEKLRRMRANVDTLSLTATPIPRTLHFSLMGARDLSIIATAPRNRLQIVTEMTQWNDDLIREAVNREIQRGGQVYFVHDRVQTMQEVLARLRGILPVVRFLSAHGQMTPHELEEVMMAFMEKRCDVLVATKIIESGLDIPNVNTIIINRADRFGMAELYQLRGRVGRSNVQAFAYLLTPPVAALPRETVKRLQAVEEFTELGSGFNLAMRDLEIRGAGNLLGAEQSGFIETMGFDTYTRILEEAVQELKSEEFSELFAAEQRMKKQEREVSVESDFDAFIPDSYVHREMDRMGLYRRIYLLSTHEQLEEVRAELRDRFGKPPVEVENLLGIVDVRLAAAAIGIAKVRIAEEGLDIEFPPKSDAEFYESEKFQHIMATIGSMKDRGATLRQDGSTLRARIGLDAGTDPLDKIASSLFTLQMLVRGSSG